jgi:enamine deaminase RidA (YjgF/YER057c/UK114 family)
LQEGKYKPKSAFREAKVNKFLFSVLSVVFCFGITASFVALSAGVDLKRIDPPTLNKHPKYSQLTTVSGDMKMVFVAGQVDRPLVYSPRSNKCAHADWRGQFIGVMDNVSKALEAGGATWDDVVFIRKFTTDMDAFLAISDVPDYWDPDKAPSSTLIEVVKLSEPCQLIEIDVMAVVGAK